jgi:hypothetical protein
MAGCRDPKVESYRVAKENDSTPAPDLSTAAPQSGAMPDKVQPDANTPAAMASTPVETAGGPGLTWTAPADWLAKDLGPMRKGSYSLPGPGSATADLSITAFPGAVGGELANINRWRGQISLDPITASELPGAVTRITVSELTFALVDITGNGAQAQRILGAMVPHGNTMWFFKVMGPDAVVTALKPSFLAFLQTVKAPTAPAP